MGKQYRKTDGERLHYRRQFLITPTWPERLSHWKRVNLRGGLTLGVHPDLGMTRVAEDEMSVHLLGYALDPRHPTHDNRRIIADRISGTQSSREWFQKTEFLGGRWVLLVDDGRDRILFSDAMGLRTVYFDVGANSVRWCSSQPGLIADLLGRDLDQGARREFLRSPYYQSHDDPWWPGTSSPYRSIEQLLPNHYLDLETGKPKRFWPRDNRVTISLSDGVQRISSRLKGMARAANLRGSLGLSFTGGLDSRVVLASLRDCAEDVFFFTLRLEERDTSRDIQLAGRLLRHLGIQHRVLDAGKPLEHDFRELHEQNTTCSQELSGKIAQALHRDYPGERLCLKGSGSEVGKCYFHPYEHPRRITVDYLAEWTHMGDNSFARKSLGTWLEEARSPAQSTGYRVLDLFYWEQRMGVWQAMNQLATDVACDKLTPFNSRELLKTLLAVEEQHRRPYRFTLYRRVIQDLWPDLLEVPICGEKIMDWRKHYGKKLLALSPVPLETVRSWF